MFTSPIDLASSHRFIDLSFYLEETPFPLLSSFFFFLAFTSALKEKHGVTAAFQEKCCKEKVLRRRIGVL